MKKNHLRTISLFFLILINHNLRAQECNCPREKVLVYGFAVPDQTLDKLPEDEKIALVSARTFYSFEIINAAGGSNSDILYESSNGYIDADTKTGHSSDGAPAPAGGSVSGMNYIISTTLSSAPGTWQFNVKMEDAKTRENVASFTKTITSIENYKEVPAAMMADWGSPLKKIRSYQKKKREASNFEQLIYGKYKYRIEKNNLNGNESTNIIFTLLDCDGEPIEGRDISPKPIDPTLGSFKTGTQKTDKNGEATFSFKSNEKAGQTSFLLNIVFQRISTHANANMVECGNLVNQSRYVTVKIPYTLFISVEVKGEEKSNGETKTHFSFAFSGQKNYKLNPVPGKKGCVKWESLDGPSFKFDVEYGKVTDENGDANYVAPLQFSNEIEINKPVCFDTASGNGNINLRFAQIGAITETWEGGGYAAGTGGSFNGILLAAFMDEQRKKELENEPMEKLEKAKKELAQLKPGQLPDASRIQAMAKVWLFKFDMPANLNQPLIIDKTESGMAQPEGIVFTKAEIHFRLQKNH